jgi:hypothetical protein
MMGDEVENGVADRRGVVTIAVLRCDIRREGQRSKACIWRGDD